MIGANYRLLVMIRDRVVCTSDRRISDDTGIFLPGLARQRPRPNELTQAT